MKQNLRKRSAYLCVACDAGEVKTEAADNRATKNSAWVQSLPALEQVSFATFQVTVGSITDTGKEAHSLVNICLKHKDTLPIVYNQGTNDIINRTSLLYIIPALTAHASQTTLHLMYSIYRLYYKKDM